MSIQITIIGLDKIGLSIGLALKNSKNPITRVGFDLDTPNMKTAERSGAVDKSAPNLHSAVDKADLILLNVTGGEAPEYASQIVASMKDGATLINMAALHTRMCEWADENLPTGCSLINATPVMAGGMVEETHADGSLFQGSVVLITSPVNTSASAIQLVVDLAGLLGAAPLFSDPLEADGLLTMTDLFPRIVSHLYLQSVVNQSGWNEAGKIAGPALWKTSQPIESFIAGKFAAQELLLQKDHVLRYLNVLQNEIEDFRQAIQNEEVDTLTKLVQHSMDAREKWKTNRVSGQWEKSFPPSSQVPTSGWKKLLGMEKPGKKR